MKIEKINDNQIKCTLNRSDLASRQIKLSELAYGTEKAKSLLQDKKINLNIFDKMISKDVMKNEINKNAILISNNECLKNNLRREKGVFGLASNFVEALIDWKA